MKNSILTELAAPLPKNSSVTLQKMTLFLRRNFCPIKPTALALEEATLSTLSDNEHVLQ